MAPPPEYDGPERRQELTSEPLLTRWITPAGLAMVLGGVVWGVQLNVAVMTLSEDMAAANIAASKAEAKSERIAENMLRVSIIVESLEKRMEKSISELHAHEKEAAEWRQRIIKLESQQ